MKWIARIAVEIEFDAKDANEAGEIANIFKNIESFGGHKIIRRSSAWLAPEMKEEKGEIPSST